MLMTPVGCLSGACFTVGTQIVVGMDYDENDVIVYDTVNIEEVQVGDLVYSYNTMTGEVELKAVTGTSERTSSHLNYLTILDEQGKEQIIEVTDSHPFWVVSDAPDLSRAAQGLATENGLIFYHENLELSDSGYWVAAKDLRAGDILLGANGELSTVLALEKIQSSVTVYNIEVDQNHNYFILSKEYSYEQASVLVHNMCPGGISGVNIPGITAKYKNLECVECAKDLVDNLKKAGVHGNLVHLRGGDRYIYSDIAKQNISHNGYHVGVEVNGTVYDNIHKNGLAFSAWINDFNSPAGIFYRKEIF